MGCAGCQGGSGSSTSLVEQALGGVGWGPEAAFYGPGVHPTLPSDVDAKQGAQAIASQSVAIGGSTWLDCMLLWFKIKRLEMQIKQLRHPLEGGVFEASDEFIGLTEQLFEATAEFEALGCGRLFGWFPGGS